MSYAFSDGRNYSVSPDLEQRIIAAIQSGSLRQDNDLCNEIKRATQYSTQEGYIYIYNVGIIKHSLKFISQDDLNKGVNYG